jgi:hypothetical protein
MSLSNWDTMAFDEKGEPTNGVFVSKLGVCVAFYKNWLYVRDEKAWEEGGAYIKPTVMHVQSGDLHYKDVGIHALRGPQNGIFAVVYSGYGKEAPGMLGCGVSGYEGDDWVGVTPATIEWWAAHLEELEVPFEIDLKKGQRFNQGDAYFAKALGEDVPATNAGEAEKPVMETIVERLKGGDE